MKPMVKQLLYLFLIISPLFWLSSCGNSGMQSSMDDHAEDSHNKMAEPLKGPNGGRLLNDGDVVLELAIFEAGVPPEFRVWVSQNGQPIAPEQVDLEIRLTRLGGNIDHIGFNPEADYLRGDSVVYEPHSFVVNVEASISGQKHFWEYNNFEGRTSITTHAAEAFGIYTSIAGPAVLDETVEVYGRIVPNQEAMREVSARFEGSIQSVSFSIGDSVKKGQTLASIESNESLNTYSIKAPISGIIIERNANPGEQTGGRHLFAIMDRSTVWASLSLFPRDRSRIAAGASVEIKPAIGGAAISGVIARVNVIADANQTVKALVVLDNTDGQFLPGTYVVAQIKVAEHQVPLAVKRSGLQAFRDFTVVYTQVGQQYEVRMLELGLQDEQWVEVLGGLDPGTEYVSENSYIIKADIEKSGASHDH